MIRHVVMWTLKDHAEGNDRATNARLVKQRLEALHGKIPGLRAIEVGIDFSATADSADVVLVSDFDSEESLHAYHSHPEHEAVKGFVAAVRADRRLVDYRLGD